MSRLDLHRSLPWEKILVNNLRSIAYFNDPKSPQSQAYSWLHDQQQQQQQQQ